MIITVNRKTQTEDGIFGELSIDQHPFKCVTLEKKSKAIGAGTYSVEFTYSPTFNRIMPLINVPGREGIRIHWANYPFQLEGCIAVGDKVDGDAIDDSRTTFNQLWNIINEEKTINIVVNDEVKNA